MPSLFSVWLKKRSSLSRKLAAAALKRASLHKTFKLKSLHINSIDPYIKWQNTELQKQIWWSFKSIFPKPLNKLYMSNCTKLHHFSFRGRTSMAPALIMPPPHTKNCGWHDAPDLHINLCHFVIPESYEITTVEVLFSKIPALLLDSTNCSCVHLSAPRPEKEIISWPQLNTG